MMKRVSVFSLIFLTITAMLGATVLPVSAHTSARPMGALSTSLVAYWNLDETTSTRNDSYGANHLTSNNSVDYATGKNSNAASFVAASSQYLSISDNTNLSVSDDDFTFALWVYPTSNADTRFFAKGGSPPEYDFIIVDGTGIAFRAGSGISPYVSFTANTWSFLVGWHDSVNNQVCVSINNGTAQCTSYSSGASDSTYDFLLGKGTGGSYYNGRIDEVAFWKNRVLSSGDRTSLYNSGSGCFYVSGAWTCEATATPTATNTPLPPTATNTPTNTPLPPTATNTPLPPTATNTPLPPTATDTPLPPTATNTPLPPTATNTPTITNTPTATFTPTPRNIIGIDLQSGNELTIRREVTFGEIILAIVGAALLLLLLIYFVYEVFQRWT